MICWLGFFAAALAAPHLSTDRIPTDELSPQPHLYVPGGADLVLEHTEVVADVRVGLAVVSVTQSFYNPHSDPVDAVYVFPLPTDAAVRDMTFTCGGRRIDGVLMEAESARDTYDDARRRGQRAALLEQQRDNVFTQHVGGICPGDGVEVELEYVQQVPYEDGRYELVFPTTMGPRYAPGDLREAPLIEPLRPHRDIGITVHIDEGMPIETLFSDSHDIAVIAEDHTGGVVTLAGGDDIPNKDFSLVWTLAGRHPRAAATVSTDDDGQRFIAVTLEPQVVEDLVAQRKRELLFVLDSSCSMRGEPWRAAVATVGLALSEMQPYDTFNLVRFSDEASSLFDTPQQATAENITAARRWMSRFQGGGTEMRRGVLHSLRMPGDPEALRLLLLLTDGYIGNEKQVFADVEDNLGDARLFSLGIGSSVNRYLLDGLAEMGRGDVSYQLPGTPLQETVDAFYRRIAHPALTDITVDFGDLEVTEQYPSRIGDLWAGQPLRVVAKAAGSGRHRVRIYGSAARESFSVTRAVDLDSAPQHEAVTTLWARRKIADLTRNARSPEREITEVALSYGLVSDYTSLVAVERQPSPCAGAATTVDVPLYTPEGTVHPSYGPHDGAVGAGTGVLGALGGVGAKGAFGSGGLGMRGSGLGGGGTAVGLGGLGTKGIGAAASGYGSGGGSFGSKAAGAIRSVAGDPIILGALDRSLIDEVVKRHLNQIRYCYQRELSKNPTLEGKVVVKFTIQQDGTVSEAEVKSTTLGNEVVEECIIGRFLRMKFPSGKGGGIVMVSYPFIFKPG